MDLDEMILWYGDVDGLQDATSLRFVAEPRRKVVEYHCPPAQALNFYKEQLLREGCAGVVFFDLKESYQKVVIKGYPIKKQCFLT
jgi:hypothetical protein